MLSQTAEYALRAVVWLASHPDRLHTTGEIAEATRVPAGYLSKVLQGLGRAGVVNAQRGIGGGFTLARPAKELTILDVVNAVDPIQRITTCPLGLKAHGTHLCPLHRKLDDALAIMEQTLREGTLVDLLAGSRDAKPLCEAAEHAEGGGGGSGGGGGGGKPVKLTRPAKAGRSLTSTASK